LKDNNKEKNLKKSTVERTSSVTSDRRSSTNLSPRRTDSPEIDIHDNRPTINPR